MSPSAEVTLPIRGQNGISQQKICSNGLDASSLTYDYTTTPRPVPDEATANAAEETVCTDHMITVQWKASTGWDTPELKPFGPLSLLPTASVLHYSTECFEGLKVYRGFDGKLRVFRLERNAARFRVSAQRMALPDFEPSEVKKLIMALLSVDGDRWLPKDRPGSFLYVRPTLIGTHANLGVQAPKKALMYIIVSFMARLDTIEGGLRLYTNPETDVRAWVGGFGYCKVGANYGPTVVATREASSQGFQQILWLYGENGQVTEAGGSNFFIVWKRKDGTTELVTAPLDDKLTLDGVVRRSCLDLAQERLSEELEITERTYTIAEVIEASSEGRLLEAFVTGTAWYVCAVSQIRHRAQDIHVPMGPEGDGGDVCKKIKGWLGDILYGGVDHDWAEIIEERQIH
ncbi:branched-chain amino acid aminotransferase [Colletotrichum chrysophilum]|uniref:Branched-chain-amino-acid aminotransferase n=1 Tax=Colletotrichum chrysophilum TaxID=1836956 RepID=A0AAD9AZ55_9PEZI|nr:branched-chain amino acid aminotransferase [Colletotrichum chrysophilum]